MTRSKKLIVGNWKMNFGIHEASLYANKLANLVAVHRDVEVVLAPTMLALQTLSLQINHRQFKLAAQNIYWRDHGAFTGEVSASQLRGVVQYAIIGHSERRHIFGETDKDITQKVQAAVRNHIKPIICVGETAAERADGHTNSILHHQLTAALANVTSDELENLTIAYEPVWAIGTGDNAAPQDVAAAYKTIRSHVEHLFGNTAANSMRVLYGGSVTSDSAADYMAIPGVNGLLVGGASLDAHQFVNIVKKAHAERTV